MILEDSLSLTDILKEFLDSLEAKSVVVVDKESIPITALSKEGYFDAEFSQQVSSISGSLFDSGTELGNHFELGEMNLNIMIYKEGIIIGKLFDTFCVIMMAQFNANNNKVVRIANQFTQMNEKYQAKLTQLVDFYKCSTPALKPKSSDLKELFLSELKSNRIL
jgi:predicted regulator of Ras-like GTPase activity (Roadblock/LC7/MglB family)